MGEANPGHGRRLIARGRGSRPMRLGASGLGVALAAALLGPPPAAAQVAAQVATPAPRPCVSPIAACAEWVALDGSGARALVYRTHPLTEPNPRIRRALIMVHGTLRNADHYFITATGAAFIAGVLDDTLVIAPALHSSVGECDDKLAPREVSWSCSGDTWRSGGQAVSDPQLSSFDFIDQVLRALADRRVFPNLSAIVVAGHSAGGQFVARYAMASRAADGLGVPVSFVVANPSSYAWPDATRPLPTEDAAPDAAVLAWRSEAPHTAFRYGPFDPAKAPGFDQWPYGLEGRTGGYTAKMSDDQLKSQLVSRKITFLLSQVDTLPLGGFDSSPQAMAQGVTRRARGEAYVNFINTRLGATDRVLIVPECGHNDRCVYTTDAVLPVIFPGLGARAQTNR